MVLTDKALQLINTPHIRLQLAVALTCTEQTIIRYINANSDDLTKAAALKVIRKETGLSDDKILKEIPSKELQK